VERATEAVVDQAPSDRVGVAIAVAVGVLVVALFAAGGSLLVDWGFTLRSEGDRLTAERGLLTRRTVSIDRERIRGLDVRDTPLRRPFGLAAVTAIAGGVRRSGGRTTLAPIAPAAALVALLRAVDPLAPDPRAQLATHPRPARTRRFLRALLLPALATGAAILLGWWWVAAAGLAATAVLALLAADRYRQLGHRFDGRRLAVREGSLRRRWAELDPDGIVSFDLRSSPTQRRSGLATLILHLDQGAGSRRVLDAGDEQTRELLTQVQPRLFELLVPRVHREAQAKRLQKPGSPLPHHRRPWKTE
jgi:putative membrane protein